MSKVYAKVDGREIRDIDIQEVLNSYPQEHLQRILAMGEKAVVEEAIRQELIYKKAQEDKIEETEEFKAELDRVKKQLLKSVFLHKMFLSVEPTEKEVEDYYNSNRDKFKNHEQVRASHILVKTLEEAEDVLKELETKSFEEVAKEKSTCPSSQKGGDLGFFSRGMMVKEFEDASFSMEKGKVSDPVQTQFGYHIIKVEDKKEASEKTLAESKNEILNILTQQKSAQKYDQILKELEEKYKVERM